ncbi:MAG TPA: GNAT family protein [Solirubrobacteraceae bacterium]|nr:GNAT family protein [Solirubrobacteraceae bacterium]
MNRELPTLRAQRIVLRALHADDAAVLADLVTRPEVARWWGSRPDDVEHHRAGFVADAAGNDAFAIEVDGRLAGWLGVYEEDEPDYRHAGLDIFLDPAIHGAGLGPQALRMAAAWLIGECGHHRLIIDPAAANERAIAVYESIGFRSVGIMRAYERGADGHWHDALLMDMLADELRG